MSEEPIKYIPPISVELELEQRTYNVVMNGNEVGFKVYGEEDDLDTLEMLIAYLVKAAAAKLPDEDDEDLE